MYGLDDGAPEPDPERAFRNVYVGQSKEPKRDWIQIFIAVIVYGFGLFMLLSFCGAALWVYAGGR